MKQLVSIWSALDARRRVVLIVATLAVTATVVGILRLAAQSGEALLYAGLEPSMAGEVVQALDQRGVRYSIRGDAIFVPAGLRDSLRMALAAEGLPPNSEKGYELLDSISGFGTTAQMFDAAYWRAKEGELARTIVSAPGIKAARVHIAAPSSNPFRRELRPTASVSVTASGRITPERAKAIRYLVAAAVAGLVPEDVSVIDSVSGVVVSADEEQLSPLGQERAEILRQNIQRLLEARVGPGRAVVEVSVETDLSREEISERRLDPEGRVAVSSDTLERSRNSSETGPAPVTVGSNLPDGEAGGQGNARAEDSETREIVNYEISEIRREVVKAPGQVRRITVAALVDGLREIDAQTGETVWRPRSQEELDALRELVASAVGFDSERGDTITLKSMEFPPLPEEGTGADVASSLMMPLDPMRLVPVLALALVALVLGLFVVRPVLRKGAAAPRALPLSREVMVAAPAVGIAALSGAAGTQPDDALPALPPGTQVQAGAQVGAGAAASGGAEPAHGRREEERDPVERLRALIGERREETLQILRSWMEEGEETR